MYDHETAGFEAGRIQAPISTVAPIIDGSPTERHRNSRFPAMGRQLPFPPRKVSLEIGEHRTGMLPPRVLQQVESEMRPSGGQNESGSVFLKGAYPGVVSRWGSTPHISLQVVQLHGSSFAVRWTAEKISLGNLCSSHPKRCTEVRLLS